MPEILKWVIVVVVCYCMGNFATGITVAKLMGKVDIRKVGSNNAGTTNVLRTLGWVPSLLTFVGDALKGFLGAWIGYLLCGRVGAYAGGIAVILGHNWPAFYGFKGGKGIATSFGVILFINPWFAPILLCCQVVLVALTKYMSVGSMASAALFFVLTLVTRWGQWVEVALSLVITVLAIFSHRANIKRLMEGTENRLDFAKINSLSKKKSGR